MMQLIGDVGGLYGAIVVIPSLFVSYFAERSFMRAVTKELPTKGDLKKGITTNSLQQKLASKQVNDGDVLTSEDVNCLIDEANSLKKTKVPKFRNLTYVKWICKRDKLMRFQKRLFDKFDDRLDIQRIISMQLNLLALVHVLLSPRQRLLFRHQDLKALKKNKLEWHSDSESATGELHEGEKKPIELSSDCSDLDPVTSSKRHAAFAMLENYRISS